VTAKVEEDLVPTARRILSDDRSVDLASRRAAYRTEGWDRFDVNAPEYSADQVSAEQDRYRRI